jgi:hypothetical protein
MVLAVGVLVLLRLPRPFRKVRGELPVLSDLPSDAFAFLAVLPALTDAVLRRFSPSASSASSSLFDQVFVTSRSVSRFYILASRALVFCKVSVQRGLLLVVLCIAGSSFSCYDSRPSLLFEVVQNKPV